MPLKTIPAEALLDLRRRLTTLPPQSTERRQLVRETAAFFGMSELLNVRTAEVRALLHGQLPEERTTELKQQILKTGIPL